MQISSAISTETDLEQACHDATRQALEGLQGADVDLCLLFVASTYGSAAAQAPRLITEIANPTRLFGCMAAGIVGGGIEIEHMPAVSVTLVASPGADFEIQHLIDHDLPNDDLGPDEWHKLFVTPRDKTTGFLVIPDPFSFRTEDLLNGLDFAYPNAPKIGGLASGSAHPGGNALFIDQTIYQEGAIVLQLSGNIAVETVVAQGCRPIGAIGKMTKIQDNRILAIDNQPAMQFLQDQLGTLPEADLELASKTPLFLGIAMDPFSQDEPQPGDFLIRNVIGFDPDSGSLSMGSGLGVGRQIQFHLRDRDSSERDLEQMLVHAVQDGRLSHPDNAGALLFSCLGRGEGLFGQPNHDSDMFQRIVGRTPLSGFFCNGEIGPVQGATHIHGYTSAFGVLRSQPS